jgi:hypothetical protein
MSTPPTWPLPQPERPNPFAPPAAQPDGTIAGAPSPYGAGYAPPTGYDAAPTPPPGYSQTTGYPPPPPGYGAPQGQSYGYPQGPSYGYPQGQGAYGYPQGQGACGYPQPQWGNPEPPWDGLAIASMSVSGAGIVTMGITGPVGIGLGIASLRKIRRTGARGRGLAWAGIAGYLTFDERLWPGDCLEVLPAADLLAPAFVDCAMPHAAEVLAYEDFRVAPTASADRTLAGESPQVQS